MRTNVLVTGGTGVLGFAITSALMNAGMYVTATFCHDGERATALACCTGCRVLQVDGTEEREVRDLFEEQQFHHVVHCIGATADALLLRQSPAQWSRVLRTNIDSAFLVLRESLRTLGSGTHVLVVGSRVGLHGYRGQSAYAAAKGAVAGLTMAAAAEGAPQGISVNCIFPGYAPSGLSAGLPSVIRAKREKQNLIPDAEASEPLAAFIVWELEYGRSTGQIYAPDCRLEGDH